ncbi:MAG: hypothetical protein R2874_16485 [Desulfobacterales bacterium]
MGSSQHRSDIGFGHKIGGHRDLRGYRGFRKVLEQLRAFRENSAVKSIVVRIDSPEVGWEPSQEIYRKIRKTVAQKKVIASLGGIASGRYYIAAAADDIIGQSAPSPAVSG